jgi:general stress protein YciG
LFIEYVVMIACAGDADCLAHERQVVRRRLGRGGGREEDGNAREAREDAGTKGGKLTADGRHVRSPGSLAMMATDGAEQIAGAFENPLAWQGNPCFRATAGRRSVSFVDRRG